MKHADHSRRPHLVDGVETNMKKASSETTSAGARQGRPSLAAWLRRALLLVVAASVITACGAPTSGDSAELDPHSDNAETNKPSARDAIGAISLDLNLDKSVVSIVNYDIKKGRFEDTGNIDVSNSSKVSAIIGNLPVDTGYTIALTADTTTGPTLHCEGTSTFNVIAATTTPVDVHIACRESSSVPLPFETRIGLGLLFAASGFLVLRAQRRAAALRA
jgi:hypothetical protein